METWKEMSIRQAKERAAMEERNRYEWHKLTNIERVDAANNATKFAEQINNENKEMITRHYQELKQHPESPDSNPQKDDYYKPKGGGSMDVYLEEQKTEQQKFRDELREAVARHPNPVEQERKRKEAEIIKQVGNEERQKAIESKAAEMTRVLKEAKEKRDREKGRGNDR